MLQKRTVVWSLFRLNGDLHTTDFDKDRFSEQRRPWNRNGYATDESIDELEWKIFAISKFVKCLKSKEFFTKALLFSRPSVCLKNINIDPHE